LVVRGKIAEGFKRLADEHPEADFSISSAEADAKEAELNAAIVSFEQDRCELSDVRQAWNEWVKAQMEAVKPKLLFDL
jgi:uncharacterized protein YdcH (DUF465 family)